MSVSEFFFQTVGLMFSSVYEMCQIEIPILNITLWDFIVGFDVVCVSIFAFRYFIGLTDTRKE